jgi:hypothetical protein
MFIDKLQTSLDVKRNAGEFNNSISSGGNHKGGAGGLPTYFGLTKEDKSYYSGKLKKKKKFNLTKNNFKN